ncbi:Hsp70 family protein [Franzmannia qiaohouensis]|uniref:Hsp70 family protein n=1 Tax=Franzmannia qiaohouensis TaxID=1329370 RepID=A0ABU1HJX6_9GAMM|nr:Hsp70 family protein [Halomonas qiaohouensis]MDR5907786.1 Hsp70 family protein [Halomonas qiaohouensis]
MEVFGFDFGTTNSLISQVIDGRTVVFDQGGEPYPSVVCYEGDNVICGGEAKKRLTTHEIGVIGNVVRSPKMLLDREHVHVDGVPRRPRDMVADIVKFVIGQAEQDTERYNSTTAINRAVVTIPVDMDGRQRRELREAFHQAGLVIEQFVHEPMAALYGYLRTKEDPENEIRRLEGQFLLVFDWGGGTLDLTLCQVQNGMLVQIRNDGTYELGGDKMDDAIRNEVEKRAVEAAGLKPDKADVDPGARLNLLTRAEEAKIKLSSRDQVHVYVPGYFRDDLKDPDLDILLTRSELEEIIGQKIRQGVKRAKTLIEAADLTTSDISLCLATGGIVNMPAVKSGLYEMFGATRVEISDRGFSIISEGAAWIAHDRARLRLAKNIEVHVARNAYFSVIGAGYEMPTAGDVSEAERLTLYCTDPRDGVGKISLLSPTRHGRQVQPNDSRQPLASLNVKVEPTMAKLFERIMLDLEVDDNLILHATAKSAIKGDSDYRPIHELEFGLDIMQGITGHSMNEPHSRSGKSETPAKKPEGRSSQSEQPVGGVLLRPNVAIREDLSLVPGEALVKKEMGQPGGHFHRADELTDLQRDERASYAPCSYCGRRAGDPKCRCISGR